MPKPFPLGIHIGTDICSIARIADVIKKHPSRFILRLLNSQERLAYRHILSTGPGMDTPVRNKKKIQWLAGRWAAKEAVIKACNHAGRKGVQFCDVVILPRGFNGEILGGKDAVEEKDMDGEKEEGKKVDQVPQAVLLAPYREENKHWTWSQQWKESEEVRLSISHDDGYATAVAMVADMTPQLVKEQI